MNQPRTRHLLRLDSQEKRGTFHSTLKKERDARRADKAARRGQQKAEIGADIYFHYLKRCWNWFRWSGCGDNGRSFQPLDEKWRPVIKKIYKSTLFHFSNEDKEKFSAQFSCFMSGVNFPRKALTPLRLWVAVFKTHTTTVIRSYV